MSIRASAMIVLHGRSSFFALKYHQDRPVMYLIYTGSCNSLNVDY